MLAIRKFKSLTSLISFSLLLTCASSFAETRDNHQLTHQQVRSAIQLNLEQNMYSLPPRIQGHYGLRMYRMTGDEKYANAALIDLITITERQNYFACNMDKPNFIKDEAEQAISVLGKGPRAKARKKALKPFPEFIFYSDILLRYASRTDELGFMGPCHEQMIKGLKAYDLTPALTDPKMITSWAAQLVNYVYWAKQLNVGDYVEVYKQAFIETYPDDKDNNLDKKQYRNKLYGMTHFIFASSGYYQEQVNAKDYQWILDYFNNNIDRILTDATDDIISEVGISFLLAGQPNHPVVKKTQNHIAASFIPEYQLIPSPRGNPNMVSGEHRNVLAMMLLDWPEKLHKGPYLAEIKATKKYLPVQVTPKDLTKTNSNTKEKPSAK
ncbi:DUF3541 domain-containing protein [Shewanella sp. 4_MG-2023]|uniref:DUF3541 domain-containing protein n=1 Tax=Shewanella sp. 4_MG-2023 TaxID=3062652 RepID=UPI0026E32DF2|nr:DUF3541 domain-containing protein [Shewanella sp. 4_MG-2023]MDO6679911.1 DUF3541 domain-containing protein [Shewanella sp. 4_MG-2023]